MMNSEHFERQMNFIVDQQAKIAVDVELLYEAQKLTEQKLSATSEAVLQASEAATQAGEAATQAGEAVVQISEAVIQVSEVVTRLAYVTKEGFTQLGAKIDALVDSHVALEDYQKRKEDDIYAKLNTLADSQIALSESGKRTDERLDRLAATVDRFLSNRRNGH